MDQCITFVITLDTGEIYPMSSRYMHAYVVMDKDKINVCNIPPPAITITLSMAPVPTFSFFFLNITQNYQSGN